MSSSLLSQRVPAAAFIRGSSSSRRVKPFTAHPSGRAQQIVTRVAAPESATAEGADSDFSFSLSDAKKGNEYSPSDVQAAMDFFSGASISAPAFNDDFVRNPLGMEDASFLDDVDNNEAYDADEYIIAGIPEAAPKKRRAGGRRQGAGAEEEDDLEQAKSLDKVKALEDRMVLEAALEEDFGDAKSQDTVDAEAGKLAVWDWLTNFSDAGTGADEREMGDARVASRKRSGAALLTEGEVTADLALTDPSVFEGTDTQSYLELFNDVDLSEEVLASVGQATDGSEDPSSTLTDDDFQRLDALAEAEIPIYTPSAFQAERVPLAQEEPPLDKAVVDNYVETLRNAVNSTNELSEDEVRALFGDERLEQEVADPIEDQTEYNQLISAEEPEIEEVDFESIFEKQAAEIGDIRGEVGEEDDEGLERELRSLAAIEEFVEEDVPSKDVLDVLESYILSGENYVAQEAARKASIASAVGRGELSADALAEDLEDVPDTTEELLMEDALAEDDEDALPDVAADEEEDGEQWVERILELSRVTKVVKGGKIMGFRCVAIIGNQNGLVGVGCQAGREVAVAVKRTLVDAKRNVVKVPIVGAGTVPHRAEAKYHAARCVVVPASDGTGCIAGGAVRSVLELAGVKNVLAKRIGSRSALNSARATVKALQSMKTLYEVSDYRGVPMEKLLLS